MRSAGRDVWVKIRASEAERERTRELARIGANLNQIARWLDSRMALIGATAFPPGID